MSLVGREKGEALMEAWASRKKTGGKMGRITWKESAMTAARRPFSSVETRARKERLSVGM